MNHQSYFDFKFKIILKFLFNSPFALQTENKIGKNLIKCSISECFLHISTLKRSKINFLSTFFSNDYFKRLKKVFKSSNEWLYQTFKLRNRRRVTLYITLYHYNLN